MTYTIRTTALNGQHNDIANVKQLTETGRTKKQNRKLNFRKEMKKIQTVSCLDFQTKEQWKFKQSNS